MCKKQKQKYLLGDNIAFLIADLWKDHKSMIVMFVVQCLVGVSMPLINTMIGRTAVDLITQHASALEAVKQMGFYVVAYTVMSAVNYSMSTQLPIYRDISNYYAKRVFYKSLSCVYPGLESPDGQLSYQKAIRVGQQDNQGALLMMNSGVSVITGLLCFLLFAGIISVLNPLVVALLCVLTVLNYFALQHARKYEKSKRDEISIVEKKLEYIDVTSSDTKIGKDIRLYGMADWITTLKNNLFTLYRSLLNMVQKRYFYSSLINALTLLVRDGLAYSYLIYSIYQDRITLGEFMMYFSAITVFSNFINQVISNVNGITTASIQIGEMREFFGMPEDVIPAGETVSIVRQEGVLMEVEFQHVCFSYTKNEEYALKDLSFHIKAGQKVALVGINGAGKTTIVKLMCGLYQPDKGKILIQGQDISRVPKKELYQLFSTVFQDIFMLPVSVAENVSLRPPGQTDRAKVEQCLRKAGLWEEIASHENGIDSVMLKAIDENGLVLSGGQQQKLILARALYKDAPILVLDEPTAALDPIAEHQVYESFHNFAREKTALFISHRLASTRFCDEILLLRGGELRERGSHKELIRHNGEYAEMFRIQSQYYMTEGGGVR